MTKTLFLDCRAGAAGDMILGALYGLLSNQGEFLDKMSSIPQVEIAPQQMQEFGISGYHMAVKIQGHEELDHHHHHHDCRTLGEVLEIIQALPFEKTVLDHAAAVYELVAQAEAKAHQRPVGAVHFHEVGMMDAICDIVGVCYAMHLLAVDEVVATPVAVGSGTLRCAHGILPVPAPATGFLLEGIPTLEGPARGELCTPTGAALLRHFVARFSDHLPNCAPRGGFGTKRFPTHPNGVMAYLV